MKSLVLLWKWSPSLFLDHLLTDLTKQPAIKRMPRSGRHLTKYCVCRLTEQQLEWRDRSIYFCSVHISWVSMLPVSLGPKCLGIGKGALPKCWQASFPVLTLLCLFPVPFHPQSVSECYLSKEVSIRVVDLRLGGKCVIIQDCADTSFLSWLHNLICYLKGAFSAWLWEPLSPWAWFRGNFNTREIANKLGQ